MNSGLNPEHYRNSLINSMIFYLEQPGIHSLVDLFHAFFDQKMLLPNQLPGKKPSSTKKTNDSYMPHLRDANTWQRMNALFLGLWGMELPFRTSNGGAVQMCKPDIDQLCKDLRSLDEITRALAFCMAHVLLIHVQNCDKPMFITCHLVSQ